MDATKAAEIEGLQAEFMRSRQLYHDLRGRLLVQHLPFLDQIVSHALRRLPPRVNRDELRSEVATAMLDLLDRYDGRVPLTAFARPRLVGAIKDWCRRQRLVAGREFSLDQLIAEHD